MPVISRYRLVRCLGRGGVAEVYEAYLSGEAGFERRVAVKRLLEDQSHDESSLRSFQDEARIASQLHHANIVGVVDYGVQDGQPFIAIEYVDGIDAGKMFRLAKEQGTSIPPAIALHIATEIAHALDYAHQAADAQGQPMAIVHRDVSPENILISWQGDVKLTDFGIALAVRRLEQTRVGIAKGKLHYMAPEQIRGGNVDGRADIFALGCALHALIAGKSPIHRDLRLQTGPAEIDQRLDPDVQAIVRCATSIARHERYTDARAMAEACGTALARRLTRDARTTMREWIGTLGATPARSVKKNASDLLNVELVLEVDSGPVRRFASRIAPPEAAIPDEEQTRATEVDRPPPDHDTAIKERDTAIKERDTVIKDRSTQRLPYVVNPTRVGARPSHLAAIGIAIGAVGVITLLITVLLRSPDTPLEVVTVEPSAAPLPVAVAKSRELPVEITQVAPIEQHAEKKPPANNVSSAAPARAPDTAELRATLARTLAARGLSLEDLDALDANDPLAADLERWKHASRDRTATADAKAALDALLPKLRALPISPELVKKKLSRVSTLIARTGESAAAELSEEEKHALERRYFELRSSLHPQSSEEECRALAQKIAAFEDELRALARK